MNFELIKPSGASLPEKLNNALAKSHRLDCAVPYVTDAGFSTIKQSFNSLLSRGGAARIVMDITQGVTSPSVIEEIATAPGDVKVKLHFAKPPLGIMHTKLYYTTNHETATVIFGSHNLTEGAQLRNIELSTYFEGPETEPLLRKCHAFFSEEVWSLQNVVDPLASPSFLQEYRRLYEKTPHNTHFDSGAAASQDLADLFSETLSSAQQIEAIIKNAELAYLLGILCACSKDLTRDTGNDGKISLGFRSNTLNHGKEDAGFICARLDEGSGPIGGIRLPQIKTQKDFLTRIAADLNNFVKTENPLNSVYMEDHSVKTTNVRLIVSLAKTSKILAEVKRVIKSFPIIDGQLSPTIPYQIASESREKKIAFLRGYMDFRGRVSVADRVVGSFLRIGVQVSTNATAFGHQLVELMTDTVGVEAKFASGESRERDHLVRFLPNENAQELFRMGWQRSLVREFARFNQSLRNARTVP